MSPIKLKKGNVSETILDEYMSKIMQKCHDTLDTIKPNKKKIYEENISIPTIKNYKDLRILNYNNDQLKCFAKFYKLKVTGNKQELIKRLYCFLYFSLYIIKIQKVFRGSIQRKYINLHGPAYKNRKICMNNTDFITMEPIEEIDVNRFISFKDIDGFIYGFDLASLHNLYQKNKKNFMNPYNRSKFPERTMQNIKSILLLSKVLEISINLVFEDVEHVVSSEKLIELRALSLFQTIDSLGNYSNPEWFLSLSKPQLIRFVRELIDIWNFRAQLSIEVKRNICPPVGDPFRTLNMQHIHCEQNLYNIKKVILEVLEKLVNSGIDNENRCLGCYYVLGALTLVNSNAATSLPWLFQSVNYF